VRQPIGRKDSVQAMIRASLRLNLFCIKQLRALKSMQIFKTEIKKSKKPIAVDVLFKAYRIQWYHSHADPI
jgi:hypothetical protein